MLFKMAFINLNLTSILDDRVSAHFEFNPKKKNTHMYNVAYESNLHSQTTWSI